MPEKEKEKAKKFKDYDPGYLPKINGVKYYLFVAKDAIIATEEAIVFLAEKGYDPQYGARPVKRIIQKEVLNNLSKELLAGKIKTDSIVLIDSFDDKLVFRNKN